MFEKTFFYTACADNSTLFSKEKNSIKKLLNQLLFIFYGFKIK